MYKIEELKNYRKWKKYKNLEVNKSFALKNGH